jgi:putative ABC transport system permease protein
MGEEPRWRRYLRFWGRNAGADVEDELSFHIEERTALNEARGLTPEQARREAERRFGDITRITSELTMQSRRVERRLTLREWLFDLTRDVRHAARSLAASPVFTLTAGAALALGIGANTAVFTVVSAVLLRPLPYHEPDRVVSVHNRWDETPQAGLSPAEYLDLRERVRAFESVGVYAGTFVNLFEGDVAERVAAEIVTPSALEALGVTPAAGRFFTASEGQRGADPVVILSWDFWQGRYQGAPVTGRTLLIDGRSHTIVGIMPEGVRLPDTYTDAEPAALLLPLAIDRTTAAARGSHFLAGVARLASGWTLETANAELNRVARQMVAEFPDDYPANMRFDTYARPVHDFVVGDSRRLLVLLTGGVALVLVIACANVASLVLTRTEERRRELAVRSALGAGRWRIARQLLVEHLVLAVGAGAVGLLVAHFAVRGLLLLRPAEIPRLSDAAIDLRVLAFTIALSLIATVLVALAPLRAGGTAHALLREAGGRTTATRATQRVRHALIVSEVALSIVLLAGAGLLLAQLHEAARRRSGLPYGAAAHGPDHAAVLELH